MNNPDMTVALILHFRTPEKTLACIDSIINNSIKDIILIDNSEDNGFSISKINKQIQKFINSGISIYALSTGKNEGFARAINIGYSFAKEKGYNKLFIINSDAIVLEHCISRMIEKLKTCSICAPRVINGSQDTPSSLFSYYQPLTGLNFKKKRILTFKYVSGCCLLLNIHAFQAPLFDEDFFFYGEDLAFSYKIKNKIKILECEDAFIEHEGSGSAQKGSIFYEYHINRCHLLIVSKIAERNFQLFIFILFRFFTLPIRAIIRSLRHGNCNALFGLILSTYDLLKKNLRDLTPPSQEK